MAEVWEVDTSRQMLLNLSGDNLTVESIAWSPDGKRLATGNGNFTASVLDGGTGKDLLTLSGHRGYVLSVGSSPDGKRLATASWDQTTKVWNTNGGEELLTLSGHSGPVASVAWSPDGKRLATASHDTTVQVYAIDIRDLMALARERVTAHPSDAACKKYLHVDKCPPLPVFP